MNGTGPVSLKGNVYRLFSNWVFYSLFNVTVAL